MPPISIIKRLNNFFKVSCKAMYGNDDQNSLGKWVFFSFFFSFFFFCYFGGKIAIGLDGLYKSASSGGLGRPISPDLKRCDLPSETTICCLPKPSNKIIDFKPPPPPTKLRVRRAAHLVDDKYIEKYSTAIHRMKQLHKEDPRNFMQQAYVHCAYCDGAYSQVGYPNIELHVHRSWLFFPFHRWYLYFFEKMLGKLIDDPDFALPFWNWDTPDGMLMPSMYTDPNSSLHHPLRDPTHYPPTVVDLEFSKFEPYIISNEQQVLRNLVTMYRKMLVGDDPLVFLGGSYRAGDPPNPGIGGLESAPHNTIHTWCGDPTLYHNRDMGLFTTAARDPIFYPHHSNLDRMWDLRKALKGDRTAHFYDDDWGNSSFLFYDENAQLVRVRVKDCLSSAMLGYTYEDLAIPWVDTRPKPKVDKVIRKIKRLARGGRIGRTTSKLSDFPIKLEKTTMRVSVPRRPKMSLSEKEREEKEEILLIEGIEVDSEAFVKFDVYVNDEEEGQIGPENTEFAGSFVSLPRNHNGKKLKLVKTSLRLVISELLEDLGSEDDDNVVVSLVPKFENGVEAIIGGIKIES